MSDRSLDRSETGGTPPPADHRHRRRSEAARGRSDSGDRRPVGTSTVLAGLVGVGGVLAVGVTAGVALQTGVVVVATLGFAGGTSLLTDRDPVRAAVGTAVSVLAALGIVAGVVPQYPIAMAALALGAFGAVATPLGALGDDRLTDAAGALVYALVPIGAVAALAVAGRLFGPVADASAELFAPTSVGANLTGFSVLLVVALGSCLLGVRSLPVVRLAPKRERERVRRRYRRLDARLQRATWVAAGLVAATVVAWAVARSDPGIREALGTVAAVTGPSALRFALVAVAVLGVTVAVSVRTLRWAGGNAVELTRRGTAAAVGVGLSVVAVPVAGPLYAVGLERLDPQLVSVLREFGRSIGPVSTVLLATLMTVILFVMALLVLPAVVGLGLAPDRAAGPAFGAGGLLVGSALVVDHVPGVVVLAGVVAAMVVWDLGEYGVGIVEELDTASASRAEAVHAAGTLGVGALVLAGAVGVHALVTDVSVGGATAVAGLAVAFVGVVLLAAVLRG